MKPLRNELKFIVSQSQYEALRERWRRHLEKDPHTNPDAVTPILSQYYDTPGLAFYEEKLDGFHFRNKVRLRTYGYRFENGGLAFLEIKQRLGDRVRKIRQKIASLEARHLDPESWTFDDPADRSAFGVLMERYRLRPSAQTWYPRQAYQCVVEPDVRSRPPRPAALDRKFPEKDRMTPLDGGVAATREYVSREPSGLGERRTAWPTRNSSPTYRPTRKWPS